MEFEIFKRGEAIITYGILHTLPPIITFKATKIKNSMSVLVAKSRSTRNGLKKMLREISSDETPMTSE